MVSKRPAFNPFYERLAAPFPGYVIGKVAVSLALGLLFLLAHGAVVKGRIFQDWSWFLAVLISTAMLCLYYATHTLRTLLPDMRARLQSGGDAVFMGPLTSILSDRNFLLAGVAIGIVNCGFGLAFGLPYTEPAAKLTILGGFFLAGFVCGMAAWGIYGVTVAISAFARKARRAFDFTAPDRCGGMQFLGEALVVFSSVTLIVGVMISIYVLEANWSQSNFWWMVSLKWFWIVVPFVLSLVVLVGPAVPLNDELREYKAEQEVELQGRLAGITKQLDDARIDAARRKELREDYAFAQNVRKELYAMGTWPHGFSANLKYLAVFATNLVASLGSATSLLGKMGTPPARSGACCTPSWIADVGSWILG